MTTYRYSVQTNENMAKAVQLSTPISRKKSIEICNWIRGQSLEVVKKKLESVIQSKIPVPYRIYNHNVGHKAGMAAGRYPAKTCQHILNVIKSAESNAQNKGLKQTDLIVKHINAQQAPPSYRSGRQGRRRAKSTHIEVVLEQVKGSGDVKKKKYTTKKVKSVAK
ncbi:MAG: 50S ribosomal protein L22 [Nanoarchaeota archaeon]